MKSLINKDLNLVWNAKLVFHVNDIADLPYRTLEVNIFNEKCSTNSKNFLGRVRISGSSVPKEGEEMGQLYTLDKKSLFSHIRGEISLKLYLSSREDVEIKTKQVINSSVLNSAGSCSKGKNKVQNPSNSVIITGKRRLSWPVTACHG